MDSMTMIGYVPFGKNTSVDYSTRRIRGVAAAEVPDRSGEIMDYEASKPHIQAWSDEIFKTSDGKSYGNVREMHPRGYIAVGKIVEIIYNDLKKIIEVVVEVIDDTAWNKVVQGLYTGFSFGGKYAKKWADGRLTRYAAVPFELTLADYPCIPGANFSMTKIDGHVVDVPIVGGGLIDVTEVEGQKYELRWTKSQSSEEPMDAKDKEMLEKMQKQLDDQGGQVVELKKVSEAHKAHLEGMMTHHNGMGHHLSSMIEDCNKLAKGEKIGEPAAFVPGGATLHKTAAGSFKSLGKTKEGVEIFTLEPVNQTEVALLEMKKSLDEREKQFGEFITALGDGLKKISEAPARLPGLARPFVAGSMAKTADSGTATGSGEGATKDEPKDDGKPFTSALDVKSNPAFLKTVFSRPLGGNEIEMIETRAKEMSASR